MYTLRQAHKIVDKITARIAMIDISPVRTVNFWDVNDATFKQGVDDFTESFHRAIKLMEARHVVREQIGHANFAEVDSLIAQRKLLLDRIGMYRKVAAGANSTGISSADALEAKLIALVSAAAAGKSSSSLYGDGDTVSFVTVGPERLAEMERLIDQLQLNIEEIEDKLTAANASRNNQVVLSDDVITTLKREGIIS